MKKSDGNICARLTITQLNSPIYFLEEEKKKFAFPYSNITAGLILATSLTADSRFQFETFKKMDNDVKIVWRRK